MESLLFSWIYWDAGEDNWWWLKILWGWKLCAIVCPCARKSPFPIHCQIWRCKVIGGFCFSKFIYLEKIANLKSFICLLFFSNSFLFISFFVLLCRIYLKKKSSRLKWDSHHKLWSLLYQVKPWFFFCVLWYKSLCPQIHFI
jgi:hypothetical protein